LEYAKDGSTLFASAGILLGILAETMVVFKEYVIIVTFGIYMNRRRL